jgi:hypothetical protein
MFKGVYHPSVGVFYFDPFNLCHVLDSEKSTGLPAFYSSEDAAF